MRNRVATQGVHTVAEKERMVTDWDSIQGLLFDKDGTLIEFNDLWIPAYISATDEIASEVGDPGIASRMLSAAGYNRETGVLAADSPLACGTDEELLEIWQRVLGDTTPADLPDRILNMFGSSIVEDVEPVADLFPLFRTLFDQGYRIGIATNDRTKSAEFVVNQFELSAFVRFACGADGGFGGKPGAGMGIRFCEVTGLHPTTVAMVGDSAADAQFAENAGFGAMIGVETGAASYENLSVYCDVVLPSIAELPALLNGRVDAT